VDAPPPVERIDSVDAPASARGGSGGSPEGGSGSDAAAERHPLLKRVGRALGSIAVVAAIARARREGSR
jgi:hypothetical protein